MAATATLAKFIGKASNSTVSLFLFNQQRGMHSRNKKAMEYIAKGWNALKEVDRVVDYCELKDRRLFPLLRTAKENFELALEADNTNTHARYWLSRVHMKYHVPGANPAVGAALLIEAAEMGNPEAQYALGCQLRIENDYVQSDQQAFYYLEKAVDQLHPGALYLLGAVYLTGDCVKKDIASALWCFHRASEKGHAGAAIAYGSLLLKGQLLYLCSPFIYYIYIYIYILVYNPIEVNQAMWYIMVTEDLVHVICLEIMAPLPPFLCNVYQGKLVEIEKWYNISFVIIDRKAGVEIPESLTKFSVKALKRGKSKESIAINPVELAREKFQIAAKAGYDLGFRWLARLEEEEKRLLTEECSE